MIAMGLEIFSKVFLGRACDHFGMGFFGPATRMGSRVLTGNMLSPNFTMFAPIEGGADVRGRSLRIEFAPQSFTRRGVAVVREAEREWLWRRRLCGTAFAFKRVRSVFSVGAVLFRLGFCSLTVLGSFLGRLRLTPRDDGENRDGLLYLGTKDGKPRGFFGFCLTGFRGGRRCACGPRWERLCIGSDDEGGSLARTVKLLWRQGGRSFQTPWVFPEGLSVPAGRGCDHVEKLIFSAASPLGPMLFPHGYGRAFLRRPANSSAERRSSSTGQSFRSLAKTSNPVLIQL